MPVQAICSQVNMRLESTLLENSGWRRYMNFPGQN